MKKILFLCTGNYYRSRYAAFLFDHHAVNKGLNWQANSRGIAIELGADNVGPLSIHTVQGLNQLGIYPVENALRYPKQLHEDDLKTADLIIALYEAEHRPMLEQRFPAWVDSVTYWQAPDLQHRKLSVEATLSYIEQELLSLLERLTFSN